MGHRIALGIGTLLTLLGMAWALFTWSFVHTAQRAPGTVVAVPFGGSHPEIEFAPADGPVRRQFAGGVIAGYRAGESVTVLYTPGRVELDSFGALWGFPLLFAAMGVAGIAAGARRQ